MVSSAVLQCSGCGRVGGWWCRMTRVQSRLEFGGKWSTCRSSWRCHFRASGRHDGRCSAHLASTVSSSYGGSGRRTSQVGEPPPKTLGHGRATACLRLSSPTTIRSEVVHGQTGRHCFVGVEVRRGMKVVGPIAMANPNPVCRWNQSAWDEMTRHRPPLARIATCCHAMGTTRSAR